MCTRITGVSPGTREVVVASSLTTVYSSIIYLSGHIMPPTSTQLVTRILPGSPNASMVQPVGRRNAKVVASSWWYHPCETYPGPAKPRRIDRFQYCSQRSMTRMRIHPRQYTDSTSGMTHRACGAAYAALERLQVLFCPNHSGITIRSACYEQKRAMLPITHGSRTESMVLRSSAGRINTEGALQVPAHTPRV